MKATGRITKIDEENRLVFGWFSVANDADGNKVIDSQGDTIPLDELEKAAYNFVLHSRVGGAMHESIGVAKLVESCVFTPKKLEMLGLPANSLPSGWYGGFLVTDDATWEKVKTKKFQMFSIGGRAVRSEINE